MGLYDRILIFDTETGGLDDRKNAILELGAVVWQRVPGQDGKILGKFRCAIREQDFEEKCDSEALEINGIDPKSHKGHSPRTAVALFEDFINVCYYGRDIHEPIGTLEPDPERDKVVLGGHNVATFDLGFLRRLYRKAGYGDGRSRDSRFAQLFSHRVMDTCGIVRFLVVSGVLPLEGASSGEAFEYFGIAPEKAHTALGDAEATAKLLDKMIALQVPITFVTNQPYEEKVPSLHATG